MEKVMKKKIKVKFKITIPAEKEYEIIDEKLWIQTKDEFVSTANDEDGQQILGNDYIEEYGLSPVDNSYFEDDPNREVAGIEKIIDENGKSL
jgi:hypothetical protein